MSHEMARIGLGKLEQVHSLQKTPCNRVAMLPSIYVTVDRLWSAVM